MAFLLTNLLQNIYSDLGQTPNNTGIFFATGGSATTFVNANWNLLESQPETDVFKNMYVFVTKDATVAAGEDALDEGWAGREALVHQAAGAYPYAV